MRLNDDILTTSQTITTQSQSFQENFKNYWHVFQVIKHGEMQDFQYVDNQISQGTLAYDGLNNMGGFLGLSGMSPIWKAMDIEP